MAIQLPVLFCQGDIRWATTLLGFNTLAKFNFANYACLLCCWAAVDRYYSKDTDPLRLNEMYKGMGQGKAFVANGGDYIPGGNNLAYGDIKETRVLTPSLMSDAQIGEIKTSIDNGYPVIIGIDYNPKDVDYDSHFVVIVDYNPLDENDFTIYDPITGTLRSLKNYLGWFKPSARKTIESYILTTGPKPKLNSEMMICAKSDWAKLLRGNAEFEKVVAYVKPGADPMTTRFEDLQTVIAGIKSRQTDLENQLKQALADKAAAETEVANQKEKLTNVSTEYERVLKLKDTEIRALKSTETNIDKVVAQYKGEIENLQGLLREAQKASGQAALEVTRLTGELKLCNDGLKKYGALQKLIIWFANWFKKRDNK